MTEDADAGADRDDSRADDAATANADSRVEPPTYSTQRYLAAKRTVDDRALDAGVLARLREETVESPSVLEVGAGIGTMVARVLRRDPLSGAVEYTAVDLDAESVAAARRRVPEWARAAGYEVSRPAGDAGDPDLVLDRTAAARGGPERLALTLRTADAVSVARQVADADAGDGVTVRPDDAPAFAAPGEGYDLLVGAAFLDLVDPAAVETLVGAVRPGGLCYFPITFDGVTTLAPPVDRAFDRRLERAFHDHLDAGTGTSRAGRRALVDLPAAGVEVLAAAGSDWTVTPGRGADETPATDVDVGTADHAAAPGDEHYPADEAYFLHHVLDLIHGALSPEGGEAAAGAGDSEGADSGGHDLDADRLASWARRRHEQVRAGDLTYLTHQLDVLGRCRA